MRRLILGTMLVGTLSIATGAGCSSDGLRKDKTFTKMRGSNVGGDDGDDVPGTCSADEKGKGACYGGTLVHCSDDGQPHAVDCSKKLGTDSCKETDTTVDCVCAKDAC